MELELTTMRETMSGCPTLPADVNDRYVEIMKRCWDADRVILMSDIAKDLSMLHTSLASASFSKDSFYVEWQDAVTVPRAPASALPAAAAYGTAEDIDNRVNPPAPAPSTAYSGAYGAAPALVKSIHVARIPAPLTWRQQ